MASTARWWEQYFVRYFVGTVVGAGAILMFNEYSASPLKGSIFPKISSYTDAGIYHLAALVALGLTYCYVASAPMMVLHALRGEFDFSLKRRFSATSVWFVVIAAVLTTGACWTLDVHPWTWQFLGVTFVCIVVSLQIAMLISTSCNRFQGVTEYYWRLAQARASRRREAREYIESYRHLREHANAFSIMLFELGLAFAAISVSSLNYLAVLVLIWIAPAAFMWTVSTLLESKLPPRITGKQPSATRRAPRSVGIDD